MSYYPPQGEGIDPDSITIAEYVEVAKSGKPYTSVKDAIDSITDESSTKPYIVKVYPGVYTESPFSLSSYISIEGTDSFNTIIETNDDNSHFITMAPISTITGVAITGPSGTGKAAIHYDTVSTSPCFIKNTLIRKGYYGILCDPSAGEGIVHAFFVANWYTGFAMYEFMTASDHGIVLAMNCTYACGAADKVTHGYASYGTDSEIILDLCTFRNRSVTLQNSAVFVENNGDARLSACTFARGYYAIHVHLNGGSVVAQACIIRPNFNIDISIHNALGEVDFSGVASRSKLDIATGARFNCNIMDQTSGVEGTVNLGEFYLGDINNQLPLRAYGIITYTTGWTENGEVTLGANPLEVDVAGGAGYINTGTTVEAIAWGAATKTCTANCEQWIYVDSNGVVQISDPGVEPDRRYNVTLATTQTDGTNVRFLFRLRVNLSHFQDEVEEFTEYAMGTVVGNGCVATKFAPISKKIAVTSGKYFITVEQSDVTGSGVGNITFTYWYKSNPAGDWTAVTGVEEIDTTKYNNTTTGTLDTMSDGSYKKDLLYVSVTSSGTEYHVVYGQTEFATQALAENGNNPTPPDAFSYALPLGGIITYENDNTQIISIIDARPLGHYVTPGHNTLVGLQGGNSALSQYFHLNSTQYTGIDQKIAASIDTNGNTSGVAALISSGTMYLSGGDNITLSQDGSSIGFIGGISASGSNAQSSFKTIKFGNSNNMSFYITNGSVVGSHAGITAIGNTADTDAFTSGAVVFSGQANITASTELNVGTQFIRLSAPDIVSVSIAGNTTGSGSSVISNGAVYISGGNNITLSQNGSSIGFIGGINVSASGDIQSNISTVVKFGNSNDISFKITDGYVVGSYTGLHGLVVSNAASAASTIGTSGTVSFAGTNVTITVAANNSVVGFSVANPASAGIAAIGNPASSNAFTSGSVIFSNQTNVTVNTSIDGISQYIKLSAADPVSAGIAAIGNTASSNAFTSGSVMFSNQTNVTINTFVDGISQYIRLSVANPASAGIAAIGNTASSNAFTSGSVMFSNQTNVTINTSIDGISQYIRLSAPDIVSVSIAGNTTGTGSSVISNGAVYISGGDNITLSQDGSSIGFIGGISASGSNAQSSFKTIKFGNSNNMSFYITNGSVVGSHAAITAIGNTADTDAFTSGAVVFSGQANITASTELNVGTQFIRLSAPDIVSVSIAGNTTGSGSSVISNGAVYISGGNNITLSQDGSSIGFIGGINVSASGDIQSNISTVVKFGNSNDMSFKITDGYVVGSYTGLHGLVVSNAASAASTIGTSGTVSFAGTNVTITVAANNSVIGFSAANPGALTALSAGTTRITSGQAIFSNSNNVSFGVNGQTITGSVANPGILSVSAGTTRITSGEMQFVNTNNISFGVQGQSITASFAGAAVPILDKWEIVVGDIQHTESVPVENASFWLVDMNPYTQIFPGNMTVSTMYIDVRAGASSTGSNAHTWQVGIYTRNGVSLSLLNSVQTSWSFSANTNNTRLFSGNRFITVGSALWSSAPAFSQTQYYMGFLANDAGANIQLSMIGNYCLTTDAGRFGTIGISTTASNTTMGWSPFVGVSSATRTGLPTNIQMSELRKTGTLYGFVPHIIFYNVSSNF